MKPLVFAGNLASVSMPVSTSEAASHLRDLARRLDAIADGLSEQTTRADLDQVIADLRIFAVRQFGRKPRAPRGEGGGPQILRHLQNHVGEWLDGEEVAVVSGIGEWARRIRELRVEQGYDIIQDEGKYLLKDAEPNAALAARWQTMNKIRNSGGSGKDRIKAFLRAYVGEVVSRDDIDYIAHPWKEGSRRSRELRDELGWPFESHIEDKMLRPGEYRLVSFDEDDLMDPRQRLYGEKLRNRIYERDEFTCQNCGQNRFKAEAAGDRRFYLEVHHRHALADQLYDLPPDQLNDESNLVTYCHRCHTKETAEFQARRRAERRGN